MKNPSISSIVILMLLLHVAPPALATDGVLEINQTCALQTGCFPGDGAGFPVTIATRGSYRLTSRLDVNASVVAGIVVDADLVSIDLNGFSIVGPPAPLQAADGIGHRTAVAFSHTTVSNGTIRGFTQGLNLGNGSRVKDVRVVSNSSVGILLHGGIVTGSTVEDSDEGILVWRPPGQALIVRNVIRNNPSGGLFGDSRAAYVGNVFTGNGPSGSVGASVQIGPNQCGTNTTCP